LENFVESIETKTWHRLAKLSWRPFEEAREYVQLLGLKNVGEWELYRIGKLPGQPSKPADIPAAPSLVYAKKGWQGYGDFLGTGTIATYLREYRSYGEARAFVHSLKLDSFADWRRYCDGQLSHLPPKPNDIPNDPYSLYKNKGWTSFGDWLGTFTVATYDKSYMPFQEAREFVRGLKLNGQSEWKRYCTGMLGDRPPKPDDIPSNPNRVYKDDGWSGLGDWLGTGTLWVGHRSYRSFAKARSFVHKLRLRNQGEWQKYCKGKISGLPSKPEDIPAAANSIYADKGWQSWGDWLGTGHTHPRDRRFKSFKQARAFARSQELESKTNWVAYCAGQVAGRTSRPDDIPSNPDTFYKNKGWQGWGDWLGTGNLAPSARKYRPFKQARSFAQSLGLRSSNQWVAYCKGELSNLPPKPDDIPAGVQNVYKNHGWISWGDWLGTGTVAISKRRHRAFAAARKYARSLNLRTVAEWKKHCKGEISDKPRKPSDIPANPYSIYGDKGWISWPDWLGTAKDE
jgi:hypothetical protein